MTQEAIFCYDQHRSRLPRHPAAIPPSASATIIGVNFGVAARFTQNNQKDRRVRHPNIAPCNCRTSQGATRQLRTLRLSHIAPCDIALSHLATFACRTLRLKNLAFEPLNPVTHTRRYGHSCLPRSNRLTRHPAAFRHQPQTSPLQHTATSYILDPIQLGLSLLAHNRRRNHPPRPIRPSVIQPKLNTYTTVLQLPYNHFPSILQPSPICRVPTDPLNRPQIMRIATHKTMPQHSTTSRLPFVC